MPVSSRWKTAWQWVQEGCASPPSHKRLNLTSALFHFLLPQFCMFETVLTGMVDELAQYNPIFRKKKTLVTLAMSILLFLLGLPLVMNVSVPEMSLFPKIKIKCMHHHGDYGHNYVPYLDRYVQQPPFFFFHHRDNFGDESAFSAASVKRI